MCCRCSVNAYATTPKADLGDLSVMNHPLKNGFSQRAALRAGEGWAHEVQGLGLGA